MASKDFTPSQRETVWKKYFGYSNSGYDAFGRVVFEDDFECDHIYPKSLGGKTNIENAQPLAPRSNEEKYNNVVGIINGKRFTVNSYNGIGTMTVDGIIVTK